MLSQKGGGGGEALTSKREPKERDDAFFFKRLGKPAFSNRSKFPTIMTPKISVDARSALEQHKLGRHRYGLGASLGPLARSQISSQNGIKDFYASETGGDAESSFEKTRMTRFSNASSPGKARPGTLFKAFDCAFKDLGTECQQARYQTNAGALLHLSPPDKKSKLKRLQERLIEEIEATGPDPLIQIRP